MIALIPLSLQTYKIVRRVIAKKHKHHTEYSVNIKKFLSTLARMESYGDPKCISKTGYLGKYQFSENTLHGMGFIMSVDSFINDPELQDSAMITYMKFNQRVLYRYIQDCSGYNIGNALITRAGILAGAHTHGPGAVIAFLNSNGEIDAEDGNCVKISQRIKQFENFNIILN